MKTREKDEEEIAEMVVEMEQTLGKRRKGSEDLEDLLTEDERKFHTMTEHLIEVEKKNQEYRFE